MVFQQRELRKRSLPVGATGRRRTRHQVTLSPENVKKINARMAAAKDVGYRTSFSGEIDRCIDEAEGNLRTARHALRGSLSTLSGMLALMRHDLAAGRRITSEDLKSIEDTVATMTRRLDPLALLAVKALLGSNR